MVGRRTVQSLGSEHHPDHPYQDPRVTVHINDGRAFIQQNHDHYDLILFALPDSLTLLAGQGSLRLENYLFTTESIGVTPSHLPVTASSPAKEQLSTRLKCNNPFNSNQLSILSSTS